MTSEASRYIGSTLYALVQNTRNGVALGCLECGVANCFLINNVLPVVFKVSKKRVGPWGFTFHRSHQEALQRLTATYGDCVVALVCGSDGTAAIASADWRSILDDNFEAQENVSVRRGLKKMYFVSGRDGALSKRISRRSLNDLVAGFCAVES